MAVAVEFSHEDWVIRGMEIFRSALTGVEGAGRAAVEKLGPVAASLDHAIRGVLEHIGSHPYLPGPAAPLVDVTQSPRLVVDVTQSAGLVVEDPQS